LIHLFSIVAGIAYLVGFSIIYNSDYYPQVKIIGMFFNLFGGVSLVLSAIHLNNRYEYLSSGTPYQMPSRVVSDDTI